MAPRREVLDSDDDGSDFGEGADFVDANSDHADELPRDKPHDASLNTSTDSTDPSFFQRLYDQQQAAATIDSADGQETIPDTAPPEATASTWTNVSSAPPAGQKPPAEDLSSLTCVTDPALTSRKLKRSHGDRQLEVIDLTDITTPRKEAASRKSDVWDLPSTTRSQTTTRMHGKRKSTGQQPSPQQEETSGMPPTQDPYDFPDSTPQTRKKAKRGTPPTSESPVMLIPSEEAISSDGRTRRGRGRNGGSSLGSSIPDTAPQLYIAPSTLTASQKQEYRMVSLSSDAVPETFEQSLPTQPFTAGEVYKSSGVTTVAYPTPSRIGSSRRPPGSIDGLCDDVVATAPTGQDTEHQQSSPDILTDMSTTANVKAKKGRTKVVSSINLGSSEIDPPISTRKTRKRRIVDEEDELWKIGPLGSEKGDDTSPPQAPNDGNSATYPESAANDQTYTLDVQPSTPAPAAATQKKRGRKKKATQTQEPPLNPLDPTPQAAEVCSEPAPEPVRPPAKRKRGRPRKPEPTPKVTAASASPLAHSPQEQPYPEPEASGEQQPLSELPHNSQPQPGSQSLDLMRDNGGDDDESKENTPPAAPEMNIKHVVDNQDKGNVKEEKEEQKHEEPISTKPGVVGTAKQDQKRPPQKVQYRVGLSKRSRIAPLLKSLKKP
ncbi:AT hook domain-containing protein [Madurella fahalii]|uniref:AT hook domain-containing protein n=1 Tax=Madurella fahalii TaxID=1157608 RepID=A0ABQ0G5R1_9PEZI